MTNNANISPEAASKAQHSSTAPAQPHAPRDGTKQALVVGLLSRQGGASLNDLASATGWLPHTTRAALTGLRKRGFAIQRTAGEGGTSLYQSEAAEKPKARDVRRRMREIAASLEA